MSGYCFLYLVPPETGHVYPTQKKIEPFQPIPCTSQRFGFRIDKVSNIHSLYMVPTETGHAYLMQKYCEAALM